jgi:hypothetical protein
MRSKRVVSLTMLALMLLGTVLSMTVQAEKAAPSPSAAPAPAEAPATSPPGGEELVAKRDRFSSTYATDQPGINRKIISSGPVHYRNGDAWDTIDTRLVRRQTGTLSGAANDFSLEIAERPSDQRLVTMQRGDTSVAWGPASGTTSVTAIMGGA